MNQKIGKALVVGAGIGGIRAALDLAETGYGVTLIDRAPNVGGILSQLDWQFPSNHCGMCKMLPLVDRDVSSQFCLRKGLYHDNIDILPATELTAVEGEAGRFSVSLRENPTWVDPDRCMGCGLCAAVCPVEAPDRFNEGLSLRKAIYLPIPHTAPNPYVIDSAACNRCGECEKVCPTGAIQLGADLRRRFRILVVDDERIVRDSLRDTLEEEGFGAEAAASGPEALQMLDQSAFHLMLTDIKMPGMDGVALLKAALEAHPELTVLMMTAYATVDTAVSAMKIGALDYLVKPFDPEVVLSKVASVFERQQAARDRRLEVGAIVVSTGADYFDPSPGKGVFGYGAHPNVVTALELERMLSGTGPCPGRLFRPDNGRPVRKIAWVQCVGSRDMHYNADYCSSICCMHAVKEAMLVRERVGEDVECVIFYMDMRTIGKSFQRYRDRAEAISGVRFERGRVHSISWEDDGGGLRIRRFDPDGACRDERFDMAVLSVGQRPAIGTERLAAILDLPVNRWGFLDAEPLSGCRTQRPGVFLGGSAGGLKDISETVIHASAAANLASRAIHAAGGGLAAETAAETAYRDVSRTTAQVLMILCECGGCSAGPDLERLKRHFQRDLSVQQAVTMRECCTRTGWEQLAKIAAESTANRILIGACRPYAFIGKIRQLGAQISLDPSLIEVVDIHQAAFAGTDAMRADTASEDSEAVFQQQRAALEMALARLKHREPETIPCIDVSQSALVVGGGIAGMTAALAIADHGYPVHLVERERELGGNLGWLQKTIDGASLKELLSTVVGQVQKHPNIEIHAGAEMSWGFGQMGRFYTAIRQDQGAEKTLEHGVAVLATGCREAPMDHLYGYGEHPDVLTQKELEQGLAEGGVDPSSLSQVVMIQCAGAREEPRNYCSRVCCPASLKHALAMKEKNPDLAVYILYRDMMTAGFVETFYTQARAAGVVFIQYEPSAKPEAIVGSGAAEGKLIVRATDPALRMPLEIQADLLVLAGGMVPHMDPALASIFGVEIDADGFIAEAESKWRPVDAVKEGVFACGAALGPRSVVESIAAAEAAAQRAIRILTRKRLPSGHAVADVRHSLCSLCERCVADCPYGARTVSADLGKILVNPAMCQGCGACAAVCPNGAAIVKGWGEKSVLETIDAALG